MVEHMSKKHLKMLIWVGATLFIIAVAVPFLGKGNPDKRYVTSPMKARGAIRDASGKELTGYAEKESAWLNLTEARKWRDGTPEEWRRFSEAVAKALATDPQTIQRHPDSSGQFRYLQRG